MRAIENILAYKAIITAIKDNDSELLEKIHTHYKGFRRIKSGAGTILSAINRIQSSIDSKDPMLACFNGNVPNKLDDIQVYKQIIDALCTYDRGGLLSLVVNYDDLDIMRYWAADILRVVEEIEPTIDVNDHFLKCYNEYYHQ